jgi:hypothetical protein
MGRFFSALLIAVLLSGNAAALTKEQKKIYDSGINRFNVAAASVCSGFAGGNNAEIAYNFFVSKGLSPQQTAGIVGNLQAESGQELDPNASNGKTIGIAQWLLSGRAVNLKAFAAASGRDYLTLEVQLEFIWFELTGEPPTVGVTGANRKGAYDALLASTTVEDAAKIIFDLYEAPGDSSLPKRTEYAKAALAAFGSGEQTASVCAGIGGIDRFPLNATRSDIEGGSSNASGSATWCYTSETNCHHDYNAADIHAPEGIEVVAAKAGEVISVTDAVGGVGSRVTVHGDDGEFIYYYAHMGYGTLQVAEGDKVSVGQTIGLVGSAAQAVGTAPHLHYDMLPAGQYSFRVNCSGAECDGYPFVDVQPILKKVYESQVANQ